jgi:hypothetical protein
MGLLSSDPLSRTWRTALVQRDLKAAVDARTAGTVDVNVHSHSMQRYAVW